MELCFLSGMTSSEVAAWVQAVGSIGAILSAVWISRRSADKALKEKRKAIRAIADAAFDFSQQISVVFKEGNIDYFFATGNLLNFYDMSRVDGLVEAINGIPKHEIGSGKAVTAILSLATQISLLGGEVERYKSGVIEPWEKDLGTTAESLRPARIININRNLALIRREYEMLSKELA